jgi:hypothetical protein
VSVRRRGDAEQSSNGFVCRAYQNVDRPRRGLFRDDVTTDGRKRCFHHGEHNDSGGAGVATAGEPSTESAQLGFHLSPELSGAATQIRRPPTVDEVFPPVDQQHLSLLWVFADPLRHIERRREPGVPRRRTCQPREERRLEGLGRTQPDLR